MGRIQIKVKLMLDQKLLDILACPKCKGDLDYRSEKDQLVCNACQLIYRVEDDSPIMLIDKSEKL